MRSIAVVLKSRVSVQSLPAGNQHRQDRAPELPNYQGEAAENAKLDVCHSRLKVAYMEKAQIYLRKEKLDALRNAAARSGRSVAQLVRDAIQKVVLKPRVAGPVAIRDGEPKRSSVEHDGAHDET